MQTLLNYGFTQNDIKCITQAYNLYGKINTSTLQQLGCNPQYAQKLNYAYGIYTGAIVIDSMAKLTKHFKMIYGCTQEQAQKYAYEFNLRNGGVTTKEGLVNSLKKINKNGQKITINDLATSKVTTVPRVAIVNNIVQEPFTIWNSNQYQGADGFYRVKEVSSQSILIETPRKPKIPYGMSKKVPGVLEIKGLTESGHAIVSFNRNYCKLCNRFIIVASLRMPEFHLGKYEIICFEGTKVYVYALNMGTKENIRYNNGNQRIYAYGIYPQDIKKKLDGVAKQMYQYLKGVNVEYSNPTTDYKIIADDNSMSNGDFSM